MAENIKNTIIPFTYDEIKENIISKLVAKGYSAQVPGTNANLLADILTYIAQGINVNTAFQSQEMLLSKAMFRKNITIDARQFGYEFFRRISYQYKLRVKLLPDSTLPDDDETERAYFIRKYDKFYSNGNTYYFLGADKEENYSNKDLTENEVYWDIIVKEGELLKYEDNPDQIFTLKPTVDDDNNILVTPKISLYQNNIENDGIELFLSYVNVDTGETIYDELWTKSERFMIDTEADVSRKFFERNNLDYDGVDCYFKISGIGTNLLVGTIVKANVLISKGSYGEGDVSSFVPANAQSYPYDLMKIERAEVYIVGTEQESNESIKQNAPIFHNSANRAVTSRDYTAICERYPNIELCQCWGGDEEPIIKLGHIWFSFVPEYKDRNFAYDEEQIKYYLQDKITSYYMKESELRSKDYNKYGELENKGIFDILDTYKIMTMKLHNRMPIYIDFDYKIRIVKYSLARSKNEVHQDIFNIISDYFKNNIEKYDTNYFHSNLIKRIDTELNDISGVEVSVDMNVPFYKRNIEPDLDIIYFYLSVPFENLNARKSRVGNKVIIDTKLLPRIFCFDENNEPYEMTDFKAATGDFYVIGDPASIIGQFELGINENETDENINDTDLLSDKSLVEINKNEMLDDEGFKITVFKISIPLRTKNGELLGTYTLEYGVQRRFILIKITNKKFLENLNDDVATYLRVKYPADNLNFYKNSIARLSSITFVEESDVLTPLSPISPSVIQG